MGGGYCEDTEFSSAFEDAFSKALFEPCHKHRIQVGLRYLPNCGFPGNRAVRIAIAQMALLLKCGHGDDLRISIVCDYTGMPGDLDSHTIIEEINRQRQVSDVSSSRVFIPQDSSGEGHDAFGSHGLTGVSVMKGDITQLAADAIVNAVNAVSPVGGRVCGTIRRAADPGFLQNRRATGSYNTGYVLVRQTHDIPFYFVIRAVDPVG